MNYGEILGSLYKNPLKINDFTVTEYLREVFEFHFQTTPYWRRVSAELRPDLDSIFQGTLEEVFENIFNSGLIVEEEYLRHNWVDFVPDGYTGKIRFYQSSGTTRERAIGHWDRGYLFAVHRYLRTSLDEVYALNKTYDEKHRMRTIAHGPYGWFQEEISELVWSYGGLLYFIGMETDGLKKVYETQGLEAVLKILDPLVRYTNRIMERDSINTVRSAPPLMALFEPYSEDIETAIISGVGVNHEFFEALGAKFEGAKLIPLYGYYLIGDLMGIHRGKEFWYYPNYPFTIIFPMRKEADGYRIVKRHERGRVAMVIARPEVLVVKFEDETALRTPPHRPFKWDGFGDPERKVG
ncbi:hypothetical protein [Thermococcus sp. MAR1]|uniref:hypothetical protein n=1 Tax=Thermococcus sp. MAR1 TaxID=1638263 RepID=UPI00143B9264|nr:hypothetical protein [Thermococcus sp. MAR1]NJE10338.1 hypothetical protein [Thermococcus sp. MAR1]